MMNEGMFIALRGLGQETNGLLRQILSELQTQREQLNEIRLASNRTDTRIKEMVADETPLDAFMETVTQKPKATTKKGK